jgi:hypothetical protein
MKFHLVAAVKVDDGYAQLVAIIIQANGFNIAFINAVSHLAGRIIM